MTNASDIAIILRQEKELAFERFDETDAFAIGSSIKAGLESDGKGALIDIRLWDRPLFLCAMRGTSADNVDWVRRKVNVVQSFQTSSYRKALEMKDAGTVFEHGRGVDPLDYAAAGGGFPIRLRGGSIIGCITVSGLPQREDHRVVVDAIALHLGIVMEDLVLN